jgi:hypothetical protein
MPKQEMAAEEFSSKSQAEAGCAVLLRNRKREPRRRLAYLLFYREAAMKSHNVLVVNAERGTVKYRSEQEERQKGRRV